MLRVTSRLILREFVPEDWPAVLAYQSEPAYLRYNPWTERTADDVQAFVQRFIDWQHAEPRHRYQLAVTLQETGELIGNCGLRLEHPGAPEGDIGYELAPWQWGKGYATEAAHSMVAFGFEELRLHRIWAGCIVENIGSSRVMEKLGMQREAHFRDKEWFKGRWWDHYIYAILEQEWRQH
ncbi:MAG TPA: GNAT family protein [Ktedonobacterales bacterium]|nr:GNAT family protein [Ktedonobacterales bacterium]